MADVQIERHPCTRSLPEELIIEILLRLPVRSLVQLKCVCKSWKTLISDSQFANNQLRYSSANPSITHQQLVFSIRSGIVYYPLKPLFENPSTLVKPISFFGIMKYRYHILGSCNGLLCLFDSSQRRVKLCNPFMRLKSKKSPKVSWFDWVIKYYGFGYDQVNDKYKVLIVVQNKDKDGFSGTYTKIYTFDGKGVWKTIRSFPYTSTSPLAKFVGGTLNWIVDKRGVSSNQYVILSFDLASETYREMLLPQNDVDNVYNRLLLCVLSNCLCVCDNSASDKNHWVVWLMKEYGVVESWTKLMIITYEKFLSNVVEPLFVSENGVVLLVYKFSSELVLYNLNSGGFDYPLISSKRRFDPHMYRESLVSPRW